MNFVVMFLLFKYNDIQVFSTSGGLAMFIFNPAPLQAVGWKYSEYFVYYTLFSNV